MKLSARNQLKGKVISINKGAVNSIVNRSPSSRQLKKYKFFLPVEIYLLAVLCSLQVNFVFFHWC